MDIKEKKQLKATNITEQRDKFNKIICNLSEKGCTEARIEVGNKDSEFTASELQDFCELYGFGLVGIKDGGVCLPSNVEKGILYMSFIN